MYIITPLNQKPVLHRTRKDNTEQRRTNENAIREIKREEERELLAKKLNATKKYLTNKFSNIYNSVVSFINDIKKVNIENNTEAEIKDNPVISFNETEESDEEFMKEVVQEGLHKKRRIHQIRETKIPDLDFPKRRRRAQQSLETKQKILDQGTIEDDTDITIEKTKSGYNFTVPLSLLSEELGKTKTNKTTFTVENTEYRNKDTNEVEYTTNLTKDENGYIDFYLKYLDDTEKTLFISNKDNEIKFGIYYDTNHQNSFLVKNGKITTTGDINELTLRKKNAIATNALSSLKALIQTKEKFSDEIKKIKNLDNFINEIESQISLDMFDIDENS